jgi:hypothetical protein
MCYFLSHTPHTHREWKMLGGDAWWIDEGCTQEQWVIVFFPNGEAFSACTLLLSSLFKYNENHSHHACLSLSLPLVHSLDAFVFVVFREVRRKKFSFELFPLHNSFSLSLCLYCVLEWAAKNACQMAKEVCGCVASAHKVFPPFKTHIWNFPLAIRYNFSAQGSTRLASHTSPSRCHTVRIQNGYKIEH